MEASKARFGSFCGALCKTLAEHAIQLNPDFTPPLNELAYCYARARNFDKAFATTQRYIPLSMKLMLLAYQKTGAHAAAEMSAILANLDEPTLEQALVTPEFRARQPQTAASFSRM